MRRKASLIGPFIRAIIGADPLGGNASTVSPSPSGAEARINGLVKDGAPIYWLNFHKKEKNCLVSEKAYSKFLPIAPIQKNFIAFP